MTKLPGEFQSWLLTVSRGWLILVGTRVLKTFTNGVEIRTWVQGFANKLMGKPLLDMLGAVVEDHDYLWDEYYFSTATM